MASETSRGASATMSLIRDLIPKPQRSLVVARVIGSDSEANRRSLPRDRCGRSKAPSSRPPAVEAGAGDHAGQCGALAEESPTEFVPPALCPMALTPPSMCRVRGRHAPSPFTRQRVQRSNRSRVEK
jgi:hypothetical protein